MSGDPEVIIVEDDLTVNPSDDVVEVITSDDEDIVVDASDSGLDALAPDDSDLVILVDGSNLNFLSGLVPFFRIAAFVALKPGSSEVCFEYAFTDTVIFYPNLAGSVAFAKTTATGSTVFSIKKNGAEVATLTFSAGQSYGVFASSSVTFNVTDVLSVVAPASVDATLSDLAVTIAGTRNQ